MNGRQRKKPQPVIMEKTTVRIKNAGLQLI